MKTRLWAVVPVKSFQKAKTRLSSLLDSKQRAELASLMLADVLAALQQLDQLSGILVVTRDAKANDIAGKYGARTLDDPVEDGPNAAIRLAFPVLHACGASGMIVVPSDVPGIEAEQRGCVSPPWPWLPRPTTAARICWAALQSV